MIIKNADNHYAFNLTKIEEALDFSSGIRKNKVCIGIIDTGIAKNSSGCNSILRGWNFATGTSDTNDIFGHGTYVANIISYICPDSLIVPLSVAGKDGVFMKDCVVSAINYAATEKIPIVVYCNSFDSYDLHLYEAIKNYSGLFICTAGNNGRNIDSQNRYPSSFKLDNLISVAATNRYDKLASISNYGKNTVHLSAPGVNVYLSDALNPKKQKYISGTSVAAPFVAGVAGILKCMSLSADTKDIKQFVLKGVDSIDSLSDKVVSSGRLNALNAVKLFLRL